MDYQTIARALKQTRPNDPVTNDSVYTALVTWNKTVESITFELSRDNPQFDCEKFRKDCGYND